MQLEGTHTFATVPQKQTEPAPQSVSVSQLETQESPPNGGAAP
jgi:hypothetical protein